MLVAILAILNLFWYFNTGYCKSWSKIIIGGDQLSFSVSTLIVIIYLVIAVYGIVRSYYNHRYY